MCIRDRLLGGEYDAWEKSYEGNEGFRGLRINTGKLRPEEFQALSAFSLHPVPWTRNGFYLEGQEQASKHPYYAAGLYYLQEPSAMTPAACLPIEEEMCIRDRDREQKRRSRFYV